MKVRVGLAIAIVVAIVLAIVWWKRGDSNATEEVGAGSEVTTQPRTGKDPVTGAPLWLAQDAAGKRRIAGTVLLDGAPVAGATVRLASQASNAGMFAEPRVETDSAGRFAFSPQIATTYTVIAEKPRVTGARLHVDLRDPNARSEELKLVLHPCDASMHGVIRDSSGGAIAKARISQLVRGISAGGVEADNNGNYDLCIDVGGDDVLVAADGYAQLYENVTVFGRVRRDFALIPEAVVVGRVVRTGDRTPVAGAIVELIPGQRDVLFLRSGASDDDGRFRIDGLRAGRFNLVARAGGMSTVKPTPVLAEIGRSEEVVVTLDPTTAIAGKVIDRGTKQPVAGATVTARPSRTIGSYRDSVTQANGTFVVEHVFPGEVELGVDNYEYKPSPLEVPATGVSDVVLEVDPQSSISGRVLYGGKPVENAEVHDDESSSSTDADGRFVLRGLREGPHRVYAESKRLGAFTKGPTIRVAAGEQKSGVEIELDLAGSIAGTVVDQNNAPVPGVYLQFSLLHARDFGAATSADDGSFIARTLSGGGEYVFDVRPAQGSPVIFPPIEGKRHSAIAVADGKTHVTGITVRIKYERLAITGRVVSSKGEPIPDVLVRATPKSGPSWSMPTATSDVSGAFKLVDLPSGSYTLYAHTAYGDEEVNDIAAGRSDVVIKLADPGGMSGTIEGFPDIPEVYAYRRGDGDGYRITVTGNTFTLRAIAPGIYHVSASSQKGNATQNVEVAPGKIATVTLRNTGFGTIVGKVVDERGQPIPKLQCYASSARGETAVTTDGNGAFRFEAVAPGKSYVACGNETVNATGFPMVEAGRTTSIDLKAETTAAKRPGRSGLELEVQLEELLVKTVEPGSPADRAGIVVGDQILKVDDRSVEAYAWRYASGSFGLPGVTVKLTIEHDNKQRTVELTLD